MAGHPGRRSGLRGIAASALPIVAAASFADYAAAIRRKLLRELDPQLAGQ